MKINCNFSHIKLTLIAVVNPMTSGDLRNRGSGDNALKRYVLNIYLPMGFMSFDQPNTVICQQQPISFVRLKTLFNETGCFKFKKMICLLLSSIYRVNIACLKSILTFILTKGTYVRLYKGRITVPLWPRTVGSHIVNNVRLFSRRFCCLGFRYVLFFIWNNRSLFQRSNLIKINILAVKVY